MKQAKVRGVMTRKLAAERMHLLRKENVKRHNDFAAKGAIESRAEACTESCDDAHGIGHASFIHCTGFGLGRGSDKSDERTQERYWKI